MPYILLLCLRKLPTAAIQALHNLLLCTSVHMSLPTFKAELRVLLYRQLSQLAAKLSHVICSSKGDYMWRQWQQAFTVVALLGPQIQEGLFRQSLSPVGYKVTPGYDVTRGMNGLHSTALLAVCPRLAAVLEQMSRIQDCKDSGRYFGVQSRVDEWRTAHPSV